VEKFSDSRVGGITGLRRLRVGIMEGRFVSRDKRDRRNGIIFKRILRENYHGHLPVLLRPLYPSISGAGGKLLD
jgi:hypothetical protein